MFEDYRTLFTKTVLLMMNEEKKRESNNNVCESQRLKDLLYNDQRSNCE